MIEYSIKRNNEEEMQGQAKLMLISSIIGEDEDGDEGQIWYETAIVSTNDEDITIITVLHALANLVANVVKNGVEDDDEKAEVLDYIINTAIGMMHNE